MSTCGPSRPTRRRASYSSSPARRIGCLTIQDRREARSLRAARGSADHRRQLRTALRDRGRHDLHPATLAFPREPELRAGGLSGESADGHHWLGEEAPQLRSALLSALRRDATFAPCRRVRQPRAAPGKVSPLRLLQVVEIACAEFRAPTREVTTAEQSRSPKLKLRRKRRKRHRQVIPRSMRRLRRATASSTTYPGPQHSVR